MTPAEQVVQTEVVVVGAGPAGLSAALAAAQAGAQVTLIDTYRQPGGQYYRQPAPEFKGVRLVDHQHEGQLLWQRAAAAGVKLFAETTVWGAFEGIRLALCGPGAPSQIQTRALVLATGTYERVAAFPGWTLPGVMTAGAAQTLLKEQHILPGQRVVLAGTGPLQLVVAAGLARAGGEVVAVLEGAALARRALRRPWQTLRAMWGQWARLVEGLSSWLALKKRGVPFDTGWGVVAAEGHRELTGVIAARLDDGWRPIPGTERSLACDTLCIGYGFLPATELARLLGVRHEWRPELGGFVPVRDSHMQTNVPGVFVAGDGAGIGGAGLALAEGQIAGLAAAALVKGLNPATSRKIQQVAPALRRERRFQAVYAGLFAPGPGIDELARPDTIICRCEEVTRAQVEDAIRQGADTLDAVKVLTRCGMGNCQGRVCGPSVAALVARETGQTQAETGQFRVRPPVFPVPLDVLATQADGQV